MKKFVILIILLSLVYSLTGCKSASEVAGEKLAEKAAEDIVGGNVDIDGEQITITDESGKTTSLGGTEWPKGKLGSEILEYKKGVITYVAESDTDCAIQLEKVKKEDFEDYLSAIKQAGFTENAIVSSFDGGSFYTADNSKGIKIHLASDYESEELMITVTQVNNEDQPKL